MFKTSQLNGNKSRPEKLTVSPEQAGRRIDNFLLAHLKTIPKSRIYQMLRRGEVRANGGRIKPDYRLQPGDDIRIPPVFEQARADPGKPPERLVKTIRSRVIYEDERVVVVNKPPGLVVHAGSGSTFGVIELLRELYQPAQTLHLVHRLDKETSGCLLIAKDMIVLRRVNQALKNGEVKKQYDALLQGRLREKNTRVNTPLQRHRGRRGAGQVRTEEDPANLPCPGFQR